MGSMQAQSIKTMHSSRFSSSSSSYVVDAKYTPNHNTPHEKKHAKTFVVTL